MPDLQVDAQIAARIIVDYDREMIAAFEILLDRGDGGRFPVEKQIERIGAFARHEPHTVAGCQSARALRRLRGIADGAVKLGHVDRRQRLDPLQHSPAARIERAHGVLLFVGHGHNPQA